MRWGSASLVANVIAQLGFTALMARLLDPAAFGLMAMATIALRLFAYVSQAGLGAALVQRATLDTRHVEAALGLSLLIAGLAALLLAGCAPLLAALFEHADLAPVLQGLALYLPIAALGAIPIALLRRALRFKAIAAVETISFIAGYGAVGALLAWHGAGVWALVGATLAHSLCSALLSYALARHSLRPRLGAEARELLGYGSRFSLVGLLEFVSANLAGAAIGRLLGANALGLFNRAWLLTNLPVEKATVVISRVLFPLMSQLQHDPRRRAEVFLLALSAIGLLAAGISASVAAAAAPIVALLLGPQWSQAVPLVEVLALSVPCIFMASLAGTVCDALALLRLKLQIQSAALVLAAAMLLALHGHGLPGVAWAVVLAEAARFVVYVVLLARTLAIDRRALVTALASVLATGAAAWSVTTALLHAAAGAPPIVQVLLAAIATVLALACGTRLWAHGLRHSGVADLAGPHLPRWAGLRGRA